MHELGYISRSNSDHCVQDKKLEIRFWKDNSFLLLIEKGLKLLFRILKYLFFSFYLKQYLNCVELGIVSQFRCRRTDHLLPTFQRMRITNT